MADTTLPVTDADGNERDVAFDLTSTTYTPKTYAVQSGTWNIGTVTPGTGATNLGKAADAAAGASDVGVAPLAVRDNALSVLTPAEGDYVPLRVSGRGALHVVPSLSYANGAQSARLISAATTNATSVTTSQTNLITVIAMNNHASNIAYLKLYDKASAPTVGTDTPVAVYALAVGAGGVAISIPTGMNFANGLGYAITGGLADSDTTAVGSAQVTVNLVYQWNA